MSDQHAPDFDPQDPYRADRVRLRPAVDMILMGLADEVEADTLQEIADRWTIYGVDHFTDRIADLARKEIERRREAGA